MLDSQTARRALATLAALPLLVPFSLATPATAVGERDKPATTPATAPGEPTQPATVRWRGERFAAGDWPTDLRPDLRGMVHSWSPWAARAGYRMDLEEHGRVLTLSSARYNRSVSRENSLVADTLQVFDEWLPVAPPNPFPHSGSAPPQAPPREESVVLLRLQDRASYELLLDFLGANHPELREVLAAARDDSHFTLDDPRCCAWIQREHNTPDNELVHRLTTGLVQSRFGGSPGWLTEALAWNVELEVVHSIRSFPAGPRGVKQGRGWTSLLRRSLDPHETWVPTLDEFRAWSPGSDDEQAAALAFGLVSYCVSHRQTDLAPVFLELGLYEASRGRIVQDDGSWRPVEGFSFPAAVEDQALYRHCGEDLRYECARYLREGRRFRPRPR
ncbi:MAG: hypothetical protein V3T22_09900 [Planctomycetota bacterium]